MSERRRLDGRTAESDFARFRTERPNKDREQRRFPTATRPDKRNDLPRAHAQDFELGQDRLRTEGFPDPAQLKRGTRT